MKSLTQKTKIWCNNAVSRRFGKYPFQNKQTQKQKKQTLVAKSDQKQKMGWEKQKSVSHIFLFSTYSLRFTISKIQKHNKAKGITLPVWFTLSKSKSLIFFNQKNTNVEDKKAPSDFHGGFLRLRRNLYEFWKWSWVQNICFLSPLVLSKWKNSALLSL